LNIDRIGIFLIMSSTVGGLDIVNRNHKRALQAKVPVRFIRRRKGPC